MLSRKDIQSLRELTAINDITEAYRQGAVLLGDPTLAERFAEIERQRARLGYLSIELDHQRRKYYERLMEVARALLDPSEYAQFYKCF